MLSLHGLTKGSKGGSVEEIVRYAEEVEEAASYYGEGNRAPAEWAGSGAEALGLAGTEYDRAAMVSLLSGYGPAGENLARIAPNHRPGWDLTFSAPKSISAVWATADAEHRAEIEAAHDTALKAAIHYIESQGLVLVRSGQGGVEKEAADGLTFATFRHGTSRAQDPDLHSHCLLLNLSRTAEGEWRRLDPAAIYRRKIEIGAVYRAELAEQMQQLGYEAGRDGKSFRLKNVSQALCDSWSTRRDQIKAALGGIEAGGKAKASAALASRSEKKHSEKQELHQKWRAEAEELGVTAESLVKIRTGSKVEIDLDELTAKIIQEAFRALDEKTSVFGENDIKREIAIASQCRIDAAAIPAVARAAFASAELVALPGQRDEHGKKLPARFTTREMLELETKLAADSVRRKGENRHKVGMATIETAIRATEKSAGFNLNSEQRAAIEHVCGGADGVTCINGIAGAGKSTSLDAARRAWQAHGYRVRGTALQARAANQLEESAAIESGTLAKLLLQVTQNKFGRIDDPLTSRDVVVLDEAGVVGSRDMAAIVEATKRAGAKLVLVGHHKQYQPIAAGGAFVALAKRLGAAKLTDNQRQRDKAHRDAVDHIQRGKIAEALEFYRARGALIIAEGDGVAEAAQTWELDRQKVGQDKVLMISGRHDATRAMNGAARDRIGQVGRGIEIDVTDRERKPAGKREFAVGDVIVFRRNDGKLRVRNAERATIEEIKSNGDGRSATLLLRYGKKRIAIDTRQYSAIEHGLAITGHSTQGLNEERTVFHIADPSMIDLHSLYVGASRARDRTTIVISRFALDDAAAAEGIDEQDPDRRLASLIKAMSRTRYAEFSADYFEDVSQFADLDAEQSGTTMEANP